MTLKLYSITLLAALTVAANAQTPTKPATTPPAPPTGDAAATPAAPPPTPMPVVTGVPQALFALKYIDTVVGTGPLAEPSVIGASQADSQIKWYTVRYTGWLTDGTKFDSSYDHPGAEPITFPQGGRVILGWNTGFQGMHVGGKRRLFIPYQLAYGETGRPPVIPPKADLIFDVELVSISDAPPAPPQPPASAPQNPSDPSAKPATDPAKPATTPPPANPTKPETTTPHPQGR